MKTKPSSPAKRGRKPLDRTAEEAAERRKQTLRDATAKKVSRLKDEGKERLDVYVSSGTKAAIDKLRSAKGLSNQAELIEALVSEELNRLQISD